MRAPVPLAREKSTPTGKPPRGDGSSGSGIRQEPRESSFPRGRSRSCAGRGLDASFPAGNARALLPAGKQYLVPRGGRRGGSAGPGVLFPRGNARSGLPRGGHPFFPAGASSACAPAGKESSFPRGARLLERPRGRPLVALTPRRRARARGGARGAGRGGLAPGENERFCEHVAKRVGNNLEKSTS